jgi:hypothetical protein
MASLLQTARQVASLSQSPPPPPHGLNPGRQRFLAEAARLRAGQVRPQPRRAWVLRTAVALGAVALLIGLALGAGRAVGDSLPGQPLYGAKLAAEGVRLSLVASAESRSALLQALAEERMDEILALLQEDRAIGATTSDRAVRQLGQALAAAAQLEDEAAAQALHRLSEAIRQRERAMLGAAGESPGPAVRLLLREMERVRQEAHLGEGDPNGLRERLRSGTPAEPTDRPPATPTEGRTRTMTPPEPSRGATAGASPTPNRTGMPSAPPGASATPRSTGGPPASHTPGSSATPEPPHGPNTPQPGGTEGPPVDPGGTPAQTPGSGGPGGNNGP